MIISVIGLGYIGLPTAAIIASKQVKVIGVDTNLQTLEAIKCGKNLSYEPGLDSLIKKASREGYLSVSLVPKKADVFIIAVPTPFKDNKKPDLSYIEQAIKNITPVLEQGNLIILESTSPVGTTEKILKWLKADRPDLGIPSINQKDNLFDISLAYCPERVIPGNILYELVNNDRIVGGVTKYCAEQACKVYNTFVSSELHITDCRTAELSKLVENSFRDVNIAFANELSIICDKLNLDVWDLIKLSNRHPRVDILQPGPGVGGHCIAVDPWFIIDIAPEEANLIRTARLVNDQKPAFVLKKIISKATFLEKDISELNITCLGLTFKPDVDDLRESPALEITKNICALDFKKVLLVEPNIRKIPKELSLFNCELKTLSEGILKADLVVLLVDHKEFKVMDFSLLSGKEIIDTRGVIR